MTLQGLFNFDNTSTRIEKIVDVLSKSWFLEKEKAFKKRCKTGENFIDKTPDNWENMPEEEKENFYTGGYEFEIYFNQYCRGDIWEVENNLKSEIHIIINNTNPDADGIKKIIKYVDGVVVKTIQESIEYFKNEDYAELLNSLTKHFIWSMSLHFNTKIKDLELYNYLVNQKVEEKPIEVEKPETKNSEIIKPMFNSKELSKIHDILKEYFATTDQEELFYVLLTGENANWVLHFRSNGNRLADAFKQLYNSGFIVGCTKKDLQNWIVKNFTYQNKEIKKSYSERTLEDIISSKWDKCENPIISVTKEKSGEYFISKS